MMNLLMCHFYRIGNPHIDMGLQVHDTQDPYITILPQVALADGWDLAI